MFRYMLVVAFLLISVQAQERKCESPPYFQASMTMFDHETSFYRSGYYSYDGVGQKVRIIEVEDEHATRPQYDELFLHREKKRFRVDLKTKKCNVTDLKYPFRHIGVPMDARFISDLTIGEVDTAPGLGVTLSLWEQRIDDTDVSGNMTMAFTNKECIPFTETFHGMEKMSNKMIHYQRTYYDVTLGLNNPMMFEIPSECMHR